MFFDVRRPTGIIIEGSSEMRAARLFFALGLVVVGNTAWAAEAVYDCGNGRSMTATFSPLDASVGNVTLRFADTDTTLVLPQVLSADGGRYADDRNEFWIKGKSATLTHDGKAITCQTD